MNSHEVQVVNSRKDIDQAIRKLEDQVRELKFKRNTFAATSILPPELLSKIFMFAVASCATEPRPGSRLNWIKVSHVSRYWRAVALECPALWSNIVFSTANGAQEMLKRSKMAPLSIRVDFDLMTPKMVQAVQNALIHISRTTHLHFTATSATMDKLMPSLQQPAPILQVLTIANTYPSENYKNNRYSFPPSFLYGNAPSLLELDLLRCSIPWDSSLFANLHSLKITDPGLDNRPSTNELLDLLQNAWSLKSLILVDCLPVVDEDATKAPLPSRTVHIPHLSNVQLAGSTLECANLLNHISTATSARLKLVCLGTEATGDDFTSLSSPLTKALEGDLVKRLQLQSLGDNVLSIHAWNTTESDNKVPKTAALVELELSWRQYDAGSSERVVREICRSLPLSHLRILHVWQIERLLQEVAWSSIFGSLPRLRTIDLHGHKAAAFVNALKATSESLTSPSRRRQSRAASPTTSMFFPNLRHVLFDNVDFRAEDGNLLETLRDGLMLRAEHGLDVRDLGMSKCSNIHEQDIALLREVSVDVRWDGIDLDSDDEDGFYSDEGFFPPVYRSFGSAYGDLEDLMSPGM